MTFLPRLQRGSTRRLCEIAVPLMSSQIILAIRVKEGRPVVTDGPYLETKEHIGGFWVLSLATLDEAVEWGKKAAIACRAPVEVRAFN